MIRILLIVFSFLVFVETAQLQNLPFEDEISRLDSLNGEELLEEVDKRRAQLRDVVLTMLSSKTANEISTMEGKFLLRQDIIKRVNVNLVTGKVTKVYWEEFVVQ